MVLYRYSRGINQGAEEIGTPHPPTTPQSHCCPRALEPHSALTHSGTAADFHTDPQLYQRKKGGSVVTHFISFPVGKKMWRWSSFFFLLKGGPLSLSFLSFLSCSFSFSFVHLILCGVWFFRWDLLFLPAIFDACTSYSTVHPAQYAFASFPQSPRIRKDWSIANQSDFLHDASFDDTIFKPEKKKGRDRLACEVLVRWYFGG